MLTAKPIKLKSGDWGAKVEEHVVPGVQVEITTRSGKSWTATVKKVVWTDGKVSIVATESDKPAKPKKRCACGQPIRGNYTECWDCSRCELCGRNKYTCGHCIGW